MTSVAHKVSGRQAVVRESAATRLGDPGYLVDRLSMTGSIGLGSRVVVDREIYLAGQQEDLLQQCFVLQARLIDLGVPIKIVEGD